MIFSNHILISCFIEQFCYKVNCGRKIRGFFYSPGMKRNETNDLSVRVNNIEETLASLDDIMRARARPFLYTRIQARLNSKHFSSHQYYFLEKIGLFFSRPVIAISFLLLIVLTDGLAIRSTLTRSLIKSENSEEEYLRSDDDPDEVLFYGSPESEGAFNY